MLDLASAQTVWFATCDHKPLADFESVYAEYYGTNNMRSQT